MATPAKPVALITVFSAGVLPRILSEIAAGSTPPRADWYVGTFGVNKAVAAEVAGVAGARYAPVFCVQPTTGKQTRLRRQLPPEDAARVVDQTHTGAVPGTAEGEVIPGADRRAWGLEQGKRQTEPGRGRRALPPPRVEAIGKRRRRWPRH